MNIDHLYETIDKSRLTLIGYTFKDERLKDDFISKMNTIKIDSINSSFSIQPYLRDVKIDNVLSNDEILSSKLLLIDLNELVIDKYNGLGTDGPIGKAKIVRALTQDLRSQCDKFGYKAIITASLYQSVDKTNEFRGGSAPMYASDLVLKFENDSLSVIKNRFGVDFSISYDELKKFLYI